MLTFTLKGRVADGRADEWAAHTRRLRDIVREGGGGCRTYRFLTSAYDPSECLFLEQWHTVEARQRYLERLDRECADVGGGGAPGWLLEQVSAGAWEDLAVEPPPVDSLPVRQRYLTITVETPATLEDVADMVDTEVFLRAVTPEGVDGCRTYRQYHSEAKDVIFLLEQWESEEGLRRHLELVGSYMQAGLFSAPPPAPYRVRTIWNEVSTSWWHNKYQL